MILKFSQFLTEELTGQYAKETDIIYKDKNLVCMVPKSQVTSHLFGRKTNWCQVTWQGFSSWSGRGDSNHLGLLVRFLFKSGRKIRFTYDTHGEFHWANETGYHVLKGNPGDDVFNPKTPKENIRDIEGDILNLIKEIPEECKVKVREFIKENLKDLKYKGEYVYRDQDYISPGIKLAKDSFKRLNGEYGDRIDQINWSDFEKGINPPTKSIRIGMDNKTGELLLTWVLDSKVHDEKFKFSNWKEFESRFKELFEKISKGFKFKKKK
jgi:hypothetical protein